MAVTLVAHTGLSGQNGGTASPPIDTSTATLLVINLSGFAPTSLVDSYSNTWHLIVTAGTNAASRLYYATNVIVGPGHTFTPNGTGIAFSMQVLAFAGVKVGTPLDLSSGTGGGTSASAQSPGAITATTANELFVSAYQKENGSSDVYSVGSSFSITDQAPFTSGSFFGGAAAWKLSSGSENPLWTDNHGTVGRNGATMATFLPEVPGVAVSKVNTYAIAAANPGVDVTKLNAYAVVGPNPGVDVSKVNVYAVLGLPVVVKGYIFGSGWNYN